MVSKKKDTIRAFKTTRGRIHMGFEPQQESIEIENTWRLHFLGSGTTCRIPRANPKLFAVLIKDVPKGPEFSDETLTQLLPRDFSGAKAQRFIERDKTILNTFEIDMLKQSDLEIALQNGLFLNNQYFKAFEFNQKEMISIIQCYNCQCFGHKDKSCNSLPKS